MTIKTNYARISRNVKAVYDSLCNAKNDSALDSVKLEELIKVEGETKRRVREDTAYNAPESVDGCDDGKPVSTYEKLCALTVQGSLIAVSVGLMKYGVMLEGTGHPAGSPMAVLGAVGTSVFVLFTAAYYLVE